MSLLVLKQVPLANVILFNLKMFFFSVFLKIFMFWLFLRLSSKTFHTTAPLKAKEFLPSSVRGLNTLPFFLYVCSWRQKGVLVLIPLNELLCTFQCLCVSYRCMKGLANLQIFSITCSLIFSGILCTTLAALICCFSSSLKRGIEQLPHTEMQ